MERSEFGYYIEIRKNDEPIAELQVEAVHSVGVTDKRTINTGGRFTFKKGDKISAHLISRENGDHEKGKYQLDSTFSLERVAIF